MKSSVSSTIKTPHLTDPQKTFDDLMGRVEGLYGAKEYDRSPKIKEGLEKHFKAVAGNASVAENFLDLIKDIFDERYVAVVQRKNVLRQLGEIDAVRLEPEKASAKAFLNQRYEIDSGATLEQIKNYDESVMRLSKPSLTYRRNVMFAGMETQDKIEMNLERLRIAMETGYDISQEQKEKMGNSRSHNREFKEGVARAAGVIHSTLQQLGKGIISETQAVDSRYNTEYCLKKEDLMRELKSKMSFNRSNYSNLMSKLQSKIEASNDLLDIASYDQMKNLLLEEIKKDEEEYKKRIDKFEKDVGEAHQQMLGDLQKHEDKTDEMWKYRLLSVFLVFTPLGAFSIAGHVFNYLDPLVKIFGPIFEANKSIGEGFGESITSKQFGFLGQLMDKMEIDKAVTAIIDKTPIVGQLTDALNTITDSQMAQQMMVEISPLQGSPLLLLGIGGTYALSRAPEELAHSRNKNGTDFGNISSILPEFLGGKNSRRDGFIDKHDKILDETFKGLHSDIAKGWEGKKDDDSKEKHAGTESLLGNVVNKRYDILKQADIDVRMCKFFCNNFYNPKAEQSLKSISQDLFDACFAGEFLDKKGNLSAEEMVRYLNPRAGDVNYETIKADRIKLKDGARQNFLLLAGIDNEVIESGVLSKDPNTIALEIEKIQKPHKKTELEMKVAEVKEKFGHQFFFAEAQKMGIPCAKDKSGAERTESVLKKNSLADLKAQLAGAEVPRTYFYTNPDEKALKVFGTSIIPAATYSKVGPMYVPSQQSRTH